jgi:hypothetical protein
MNVDTYSLANMVQGNYGGYIDSGMTLRGQTSGAEAVVNTDIKLLTDSSGELIGCIYIPDRNIQQNPSFESGTRVFRLTNSPTNSLVDGAATTFSEEKYYSSGRLNSIEENIVRNEPPQTPPQPLPNPPQPPQSAPQQPQSDPQQPPQSAPQQPQYTQPTVQVAERAPVPTVQVPKPWRNGVIDIRSKNITESAEGQRLVDSINSQNGTAFSVAQLKSAAGIKKINSISDLNQLNATAKRLAGK